MLIYILALYKCNFIFCIYRPLDKLSASTKATQNYIPGQIDIATCLNMMLYIYRYIYVEILESDDICTVFVFRLRLREKKARLNLAVQKMKSEPLHERPRGPAGLNMDPWLKQKLYHWSAWPILSLSVNYDWFIDLPSVERMCMNAWIFLNIYIAHDGTQSMCQALQLMPLLDQWLMTPRRLSRLWTSLRCQFQQILCFQHHPQTSHRPRCGPTIKWRDPSPILLMTRDCFQ